MAGVGGHELDGAFDGAFFAAAEGDAGDGRVEGGLGLPLVGGGVEPFEDFLEAFEVVFMAEVLFEADAGEVFAGLGWGEEGVLFLAAEVLGEGVAELPDL